MVLKDLACMAESRAWRLILGRLLILNCKPKIFVYFELVKVRPRVARAPTEQIYWVAVGQQDMRVSRRWN